MFGVNSSYYGKFGLKGHEGIDCVPTANDWTVISLDDGVVVRDEDNARSGAYGVYLTIWNKEAKRAFQYCHLEKNVLGVGDIVRAGDVLGKMGSTGNSTGAHLHLNMFLTDENGIRQNRDNGYLGGVDPLPFLESGQEANIIPIPKDDFERLVTKSTTRDAIVRALELPDDASQDTILKSLAGTKGLIGTLQREKAGLESEVENRLQQLANERKLCQTEKKQLEEAIKAAEKKVDQLGSDYTALKGEYTEVRKQLGKANNALAVCEAGGVKYTHLFGPFYLKS